MYAHAAAASVPVAASTSRHVAANVPSNACSSSSSLGAASGGCRLLARSNECVQQRVHDVHVQGWHQGQQHGSWVCRQGVRERDAKVGWNQRVQ